MINFHKGGNRIFIFDAIGSMDFHRGKTMPHVSKEYTFISALMDRFADRLSFIMLCAVCVQIEYNNMEIIDTVDKITTI
jgi:hypothetical protein